MNLSLCLKKCRIDTPYKETTTNFVEKEMEEKKPNPFYVSLLLNGHKIDNCIIDYGASYNIMPMPIAKSLSL